MSLQSNSYSYQSPFRDHNQDSFWPPYDLDGRCVWPYDEALVQDRGRLFIVAKGTGTPPYGLRACRQGIEVLAREYYEVEPFSDQETRLRAAFQVTNKVLHDYNVSRELPEKILGVSVAAAVVKDNHVTIAKVGVSGAYIIRESMAEQVLPSTQADLAQPKFKHPPHLILLGGSASLGHRNDSVIRAYLELVSNIEMKQGDILILLSDWSAGLLKDEEMVAIVRQASDVSTIQRLAKAIDDSLPGPINVAVTAVWISGNDDHV